MRRLLVEAGPHGSTASAGRVARRSFPARTFFGCGLLALLMLSSQAAVADAAPTTAAGRVYEQVSPADKNGFPVFWRPSLGTEQIQNLGLSAVSPDGETAAFTSLGVFAGSGSSLNQTYRSRRTPGGWITAPASSPINAFHANSIISGATPTWQTATRGLGEGVMVSTNSWSALDPNALAAPGREEEAGDVYLRTQADEDVLISVDPTSGVAAERISPNDRRFAIAADGGHVLFESRSPLTAAAEGQENEGMNVYERDGDTTRLVSTVGGGPAEPECGSRLVRPASLGQAADGSRVVFIAGGFGNGTGFFCEFFGTEPKLYVRVEGHRTIEFSKSQRSEPEPEGGTETLFIGGDKNLSKLLFVSGARLTNDADSLIGGKLYEFDVETEVLTALVGEIGSTLGTDRSAVWGASADASSIFYLSPDNQILQRWSSAGIEQIASVPTGAIGPAQPGAPSFAASDDGRTMVFLAAQDLTGYDPKGHDEAYLYRAGQPLRCLSCGSTNDPPSNAHISIGDGTIGQNFGDFGYYTDSITPDGSLVVFDTATKLLPSDTNNRRDVYEYDVNSGKLSLVTEGSQPSDAYVYAVSDSGRDIFFTTSAALLPGDVDGGDSDLYDARRGGGFPEGEGEARFVCEGETCQAPAAPPPAGSTPASSQLAGPGNTKTKRKGRCQKARQGKSAAKGSAKAKRRHCVRRRHHKAHHRKASGRRATARNVNGKGR